MRAPDLRVDRSCGLTADGHAWCWGAGWGGGLGNGQTGPRRVPVLVSGSVTFRAITVGALATCGIAADGAALCWGDNSTGALGVPLVPHD